MSKARSLGFLILNYAAHNWPDDTEGMAKTAAPNYAALFQVDGGSYKYIPVEKLNAQLGLENGSGIFGYSKFDDGSYLLYSSHTEPGKGLAVWDGDREEPKPEWLRVMSRADVDKAAAARAAAKKAREGK